MSISSYSIKNSNLIWFVLAIFIVGGVLGFMSLGKKEDSTFIIKSASVMCYYPGATPEEVEQLVTEPLEREIQSMRNIYKITSESRFGSTKILVELTPSTPPDEIPQMWDELRRKVADVTPQLPKGVSNIVVGDDFGDVYGIYYSLTADSGFSFSELRDWAQRIKTRIITVDGVQKVTLFAEQSPVVNLYVSAATLSNYGVHPEEIITAISRQNSVVSSGEKSAGDIEIKILESGTYKSLDDIRDQIIMAGDGRAYRLGDILRVERGYVTPPRTLMRVNGQRAIGIGVSTEATKDVVKTGRGISDVLVELTEQMPIGINLEVLYPEDRIAAEATNAFLLNLVESVGIVIVVIMLIMGLRAGVLIGSSLIFTIGGTLLIMQFVGEGLNRTSLAGFIIAMGMLVDNAIVVTDNAQTLIGSGIKRRDAVIQAADAPKWNLLGATLIAIFSFLPLYLAPSAVAEIVKPLFVVLAISLMLSWGVALTQTPLFANFMLQERYNTGSQYDNRFYRGFDRLIGYLLRHRWSVVITTIVLFVISLRVMGIMPQNFFPSLDKPYFRADVILPEGYNIYSTQERMIQVEWWLERQREVKRVSITMGGSPPRYYLASSSNSMMPNFGNVLVELYDSKSTEAVESRFDRFVTDSLPDAWVRSSLFKLSPVPDATIEFGFIGDNIDTLLRLTSAAEDIMWRNRGAVNIRNSWGNRLPTWSPQYSQAKGQRLNVTRSELAKSLTVATSGYTLGEYREGDRLMPMLLKDGDIEGYNLTNLQSLPLFAIGGGSYALEQVSTGFNLDYRLGVIERFNRQRVMKAQCDNARGVNAKALYNQLLDSIRSGVKVPPGYKFRIFGEEESQAESNDALAKNMPMTMVLIFVTLLILFGNYRDPIMMLLMIPLIFIGVLFGLVTLGKSFNFFALLGLLGLVGMNIKNAVVLVSRISELRSEGVAAYDAIISATRSRIIPVAMASVTTILGMLPLLFDSLFGAMAATIMGGLFVATILTICVLPVTYAIFYNVKR